MAGESSEKKVLSPREKADKWAIAAQEKPFVAAKELKDAATSWLTFLTGAIGALSIGGLAFLPAKIGDLPGNSRNWVMLFLFASAILGLVSRYLATLATGVIPTISYDDGPLFRQHTQQSNFAAATRLIQSQQIATGAIASLLIAAYLAITITDPVEKKPFRMVHQLNGPTLCGKLLSDGNGLLYINAISPTTKLKSVREMTEVKKCP